MPRQGGYGPYLELAHFGKVQDYRQDCVNDREREKFG